MKEEKKSCNNRIASMLTTTERLQIAAAMNKEVMERGPTGMLWLPCPSYYRKGI